VGEQAALRLPGYEVREILHHGGTLLVYRAVRWADRHPVVVKRSLGSPVSARQLARYRNELDLLRSLDLPEVVKVYDVVPHDGHVALIPEDFPGISPKRWQRTAAPPLDVRVEAAELAVAERGLGPLPKFVLTIPAGGSERAMLPGGTAESGG